MSKVCGFVQKNPDASAEDFRHWWLARAGQVARWPAVRGFRLGFVDEVRTIHADPALAAFDCVWQLRLGDGLEGAADALAEGMPAGHQSTAINLRHVSFITDEHVIVPGPAGDARQMAKLTVLIKRRQEQPLAGFRAWWLEHAQLQAQIPGLHGYRVNFIDRVAASHDAADLLDCDGCTELWFDSVPAFEQAFASPPGQTAGLDAEAHCAQRLRYLTREIVLWP